MCARQPLPPWTPRHWQTESHLFILLLQAWWLFQRRALARRANRRHANSGIWSGDAETTRDLGRRLDSPKPAGLCKIWARQLAATCQCGWGCPRSQSVDRRVGGASSRILSTFQGPASNVEPILTISQASTFSRLHLQHRSSIALHKLDSAVTLYLSVSPRIVPRLLSLLCRPLSPVWASHRGRASTSPFLHRDCHPSKLNSIADISVDTARVTAKISSSGRGAPGAKVDAE